MKILITGANGMVARAARAHCESIGDDVTALTRAEFDISDRESVRARFAADRYDAVINCAAYTDVDGSESNPEKCYAANTDGVENLAAAARESDSVLVTISTDYVFDGAKDGFYTQRDTPSPRGVYAEAKAEGEYRAARANARTVIVRSGWIYGNGGTNFLSVMDRLLAEGKPIKAIFDAYGTPTFAGDLARRLRELAELDLPCIFHVTNRGDGTSYAGFAEEVCSVRGYDTALLEPASADSLRRPAPRPRNSRIACLFSERFGLEPLPEWRQALRGFLEGEDGRR